MSIRTRRVYAERRRDDGFRVLVDRIWPRGLSKRDAAVDLWLSDAAPSPDLRKWFAHEPSKWRRFCERYFDELRTRPEVLEPIVSRARRGRVTLVYAARDERFNNAVALATWLEQERLD